MRINWNDQVVLTPNERGWAIWEAYYRERGLNPPIHEETLKIHLWDAALIFGQFLYMGSELPFSTMYMELIQPWK